MKLIFRIFDNIYIDNPFIKANFIMGRIVPLILHKSEWKRIKKQANDSTNEEPVRTVDIEGMIEQSQKWTRTWPDTVEGHVRKVMRDKKKVTALEMAEVEAFHKKAKKDNTAEALKKARDMIFERSCYGKQLISAIGDSKAQEVRDTQIKFKKEIEKNEQIAEQSKPEVKNVMYAEFERENAKKLISRQREIENAQFNKAIAKMKSEDALKAAKIEKMHRKEDAKMIESLLKLKITEEKHNHCLDKEGVLWYEAETKKIREQKAKRELQEQALADVWSKYQERIRCKERRILDQIHKEKYNIERFKSNYELLRQIQEQEQRSYNDFIEKGMIRCKQRLEEREQEDRVKKEYQRLVNIKEARYNKKCADELRSCTNRNKCVCDKTCFIPERKPGVKACKTQTERKPSFLTPYKRASRRETKPSGWTGAAAAHAQFARAAADALAECRYTAGVRRVVQDYRKSNNVENLQIPNH
ncbi:hypothetical protein MSG28_013337 [Choristoneura fumiferana]|uniref:Uncharacterized protein n=1 Tax=Choristoneura fumiferana TaxID=7141 RepID=A0ACC0KTW5_CHOFU|nr:hypothetical protein MSG28_013337 [Choristoneura fumiferana]